MPIKNETLRKKLSTKQEYLLNKIMPIQEELELVQGMLAQLDTHEEKAAQATQQKLGIGEE